MSDESGIKPMGQVIQIDEARIRDHLLASGEHRSGPIPSIGLGVTATCMHP